MADRENGLDTGFLTVQVYTAGRGLPIQNAHVTVTEIQGDKSEVKRILTTDRNGNTEKIELNAPPRENSMTPSGRNDYSQYTIQTEKEGYYPVENLEVPIFGGQITIQPVTLIPLPFGNKEEIQVVDKEPSDL